MLKLTQEMFGGDDDEFRRGSSTRGQLPVLLDFFGYFNALTASRREHPTEDLASAIANARIDGEPLSDVDTASYYVIVATAGHDTTSATIAGGLQALIENPDQRQRLRDNLDLMPLATEEMIRWVTPVKEFMRTATADTTVRGVPIAKGESVYLSYVSGNRDEEVFDDPFRFDVGRDPNKHLAFGYGVHFCLGAALARMEVNSFFTELLPRLKSIELNGKPRAHRDDVRRRSQAPADSVTSFVERRVLRALHVQEAVDGGPRAFAVVEIGQGGQPTQHHRAHQQRDRPRAVDIAEFGGLGAVEDRVERRGVLLGDTFAQRGDRRAVGGAGLIVIPATVRGRDRAPANSSPSPCPGPRRSIVRMPAPPRSADRAACLASDGIGAGGIRLLKAAASKSFPLGKWRYRVARATLAPRVTASTVTALGPPERSSAVAASSKRARERAGRGSVLSVMKTTSLLRSDQTLRRAPSPARNRPPGQRTNSAARCPSIAMVACGPRLVIVGSTDPSITHRPSIPCTRHWWSTTAAGSRARPIGALPHRCCDVDHAGSPSCGCRTD